MQYSIVNNYQTSNTEAVSTTNARETKNIEIKFLLGYTNRDIDGKVYPTDYDPDTDVTNGKTPMIVHPAFTYDEMPLNGIWVAKFEASGTKTVDVDGVSTEVPVGNHTGGTTLVNAETTTPVKRWVLKVKQAREDIIHLQEADMNTILNLEFFLAQLEMYMEYMIWQEELGKE